MTYQPGHVHSPEAIAKIRAASSRKRTTIQERFWKYAGKAAPDECWNWTGTIARVGYGVLGRGSTAEGLVSSHRLSFELNVGQITDGLYVLHRCDNRRCVNPDHLFLGTHLDNIADMVRKGRHVAPRMGRRMGAALTPALVREIRASSEDALTLARKHGVTRGHIYGIRHRRSWKEIQ